jgi:hypothetical protein
MQLIHTITMPTETLIMSDGDCIGYGSLRTKPTTQQQPNNFITRLQEIQKLYDNLSPEQKEAWHEVDNRHNKNFHY